LTSNLGAETLEDPSGGTSVMPADERRARGKKIAEQYLSPELINRLDDIVLFPQLPRTAIEAICDIQLSRVVELLQSKGIDISLSKAVRGVLADQGYSSEYGARPLKRLLQVLSLYAVLTFSLFMSAPIIMPIQDPPPLNLIPSVS